MSRYLLAPAAFAGIALTSALIPNAQGAPVDFAKQIKPILEAACVRCHGPEEAEGELRLDTLEAALKGGENGPALVAGQPDKSLLYQLAALPPDDVDIMPPKEAALTKEQLALVKDWIGAGAKWPKGTALKKVQRIDFVKHIQPVFEVSCVGCHNAEKTKGGLDMSTKELAFTTGDSGPGFVAFQPDDSLGYTLMTLEPEDDDLMPPKRNGGPLRSETIQRVRAWIGQGAPWPEGVTLTQKERGQAERPPSPDNLELVQKIHAFIVGKSKVTEAAEMKAYTNTVSRSDAVYEMVPIPGGEFRIGSPENEADRKPIEGPQTTVALEPFWMGKFEVTWDEYEPFMITPVDRYKDGAKKNPKPDATIVDAISMPTTPYTEMSFGMGQIGFPAISMTQHAANKYCQWISAQTGHFYRLPTEAEWEYACRAGTTTSFSFGDDISKLGDYAWFFDNSNGKYQKVGKKKPNPWGLHDMHGNAREWTLDQFSPVTYKAWYLLGPGPVKAPWQKPTELYPRSVRGGSWDDDPDQLRSAMRFASSEVWKQNDPQLPKSIWYHTDARWLGFRLVRPLRVPTAEEMFAYWNCGRPPE